MEKLFYAQRSLFPNSLNAVEKILREYFGVYDGKLARTENGKPYLQNVSNLYFSLSHDKEGLFIAFSDKNVGIDAEPLNREINLPLLIKRFAPAEREEIQNSKDFLRLWTVKEAAVKWIGGTLAQDLKKLVFVKETLSYDGLELPVRITSTQTLGRILSICGERDFSEVSVTIIA